MNSYALAAQGPRELRALVDDCILNRFQPTLGIVFCSTEQDISSIQAIFNKCEIELLGCTSAGEITNDQHFDKHVSCLLLEVDKTAFQLYCPGKNDKDTHQQALELGQFALNCFPDPASIIFSGGFSVNGDHIISGLKDAFGSLDRPVFGALAGDDLQLNTTFVFSNNTVSDHDLYALIFDNERVKCQGIAISGWEAIGTLHTITKANGNIIFTIDDQPALDFFIQHFGYFSSGEIKKQSLENMSIQYPLQILKENGNSVLRSPVIGNEVDRSLTLAGGVKEGEQFRFSMSPGFKVIDQTIEEFSSFRDSFPEADAILLFSCKGRHSALGPFIADEIKGIYEHWKKPMIGFFAYGELGVDRHGYCDFHNETCSLLLIREC